MCNGKRGTRSGLRDSSLNINFPCALFLWVIFMNEKYMDIAYNEAKKAFLKDEVPVGAVIVLSGKVIAKAYNKKVSLKDVCAHAEIIAIKKASLKLKDWRLEDCEMYITLEPCPMCAGAIEQSRIKKVYIGTKSNFKSNHEIVEKIFNNREFYHKVEYSYLNDSKCSEILKEFFAKKRI